MSKPLIDFDEVIRTRAPHMPGIVKEWLRRIVHVEEMNAFYDSHQGIYDFDFARVYLNEGLECDADVEGAEKIPTDERPVVFVSNHPLGGLDGIILSLVLGERRNYRLRLIVNDLLMYIRPLAGIFVPVNKIGGQSREYAIRQKELWESEMDVLTFPAGACSRLQWERGRGFVVKDLEWKSSFVRKAVQTHRDVVPIYFEGRNSNFFYRLAYLRKKLGIRVNIEMLYLVDEMYGARHKHFKAKIGDRIPYTAFDKSKSQDEWASWVREETYKLGEAK
ncbi:MAG: 1-acyl-sn-glycerol-3-phosphate acyltransferase [Paludibacteraceae bacterium]|nr:1-acyl-sn-glycerol-3-phosphate acyltransferase [Paludibacteraceae bacterium]